MENKKKENKKLRPPEGAAFLATASDTMEADLLESKLEESGIPVIRQYRGNGAYLTIILGNTSFGIDLYVPEEKLEEAKNIIASAEEVKDEDILSDPSFKDGAPGADSEELLKKLDRKIWWMAAVFIAAIAVLLYFAFRG